VLGIAPTNVKHLIHFAEVANLWRFDTLRFECPSLRSQGRFGAPHHARVCYQTRIHENL